MKICVGIDLGSTTTKAVVIGDDGAVLGRGITNSRSNYQVACDVALSEALIDTRFRLITGALGDSVPDDTKESLISRLDRGLREQQYRTRLSQFEERALANTRDEDLEGALVRICELMAGETASLFAEAARRKSDFFRDLAQSRFMPLASEEARTRGVRFDALAGLFDKTILEVENIPAGDREFEEHALRALAEMEAPERGLWDAVGQVLQIPLEKVAVVGTGYGRQTLPFPKESIRSEILCHGLGAHAMFPETRSVLDIGGQDTKAIQVDRAGIVTSFQMNDRCAAGCGRYLGYVADEMNLGLHELGPMACGAKRSVRINSTCTVFAGAELRERLSLGEKREDILAGLHRAIILRAMSLLARSGGVHDQFTFTGGVAKNEAAVRTLRALVRDNYGDVRMNISADSIYTGALGAALFARRDVVRTGAAPVEIVV